MGQAAMMSKNRIMIASMGQKFFISFNWADRTKAHWIAWTLGEAGHEVAVHDWEIPAGGNAPLWMNTRLAWADRLIAVISPDYLPARYSPMEWASQIWNDPDGTRGSVIPVIVRPTSKMPPLLRGLSWIDLTNCSEVEAKRRLIKGVDMPAPPERKPAFEKMEGEAPDNQHAGPAEKPTFVRVSDDTEIVQRAYLGAQPRGLHHMTDGRVIAHLAFVNGGNLPARNVRNEVKIGWFDENEGEREHFEEVKIPEKGSAVILARSEIERGTAALTPEDAERFHAGRGYVYVWGRAEYDDGFGNPRWMIFCHRYNCSKPEIFRQHDHHNDGN